MLNSPCILSLPFEGFQRETEVGAEAAAGVGEGAARVVEGAAQLGGWERAADDEVLLLEPKQLRFRAGEQVAEFVALGGEVAGVVGVRLAEDRLLAEHLQIESAVDEGVGLFGVVGE